MKYPFIALAVVVIIVAWIACKWCFNTMFDQAPSIANYDNSRFRNSREALPGEMPSSTLKAFGQVLFNKADDSVPASPLHVHNLSREALASAPERSLYRLGHSSILMKLQKNWILTDPVFSERVSPVQLAGPKRFHPVPISIDALPLISVVIISHDHYDHLDKATVLALNSKVQQFVVPLGVGERLARWGIERRKIQQLDWWQSINIQQIRITATPAQHFSGRGILDGNKTLWASWVIEDTTEHDPFKIFFSGDSGYFDGFAEIGQRFGPFDLTLMETGAYNAQWSYVHLHPKQSVQAHLDLQGRWLLPIHNGTFDLALHSWNDPFEQVLHYANLHNVQVSIPVFGERVDMTAPV
ncbi:MBL fold metallo-hydrolase [Rheinheimera sp. NSM]|uniref:MBL fold metallo-hydrolase n=1 Tax=Rheinheimera sp. NSM TaxID=3457884 RepID=UPI0040355493